MGNIGMIMTVGVGGQNKDSLIGALKGSILKFRPDVLAFVFSEGSVETTSALKEELGEGYKFIDHKIVNENNVDQIFAEITELINELLSTHHCDLETLEIDFTSGTKAMSAGAILAAVSSGIQSLRYIHGQRLHGTVQSGLEEISQLKPSRYLAHYNLKLAIAHFKELRFSTSIEILKDIPEAALSGDYYNLHINLQKLAQIYQAWDLFDHKTVFELLKTIERNHKEIQRLCHSKEIIHRLIKLNDAIKQKQYSLDMLADIYNNAQRRIIEGKYDDATARLYRVTEMCAQYVLQKEKQIDTDDVKRDQVPITFLKKYSSEFKGDKKVAQLPLHKSYELLQCFGEPMGKRFSEFKELKNTLTSRNQSILAHGIESVNQATCEKFYKNVLVLLEFLDNKFQARCEELQFPWIKN